MRTTHRDVCESDVLVVSAAQLVHLQQILRGHQVNQLGCGFFEGNTLKNDVVLVLIDIVVK